MTIYAVKNVKTFHGHDGGCWEATLYCDGKRVAICTEDGWGGELQFHWLRSIQRVNDDSKALDAFCKTLPQWELYDGEMTDTCADIYVGDLVNAFLTAKDLRKVLKKFAIADGGKIYTWNRKPDDLSVRFHVKKKHPNAVILNDIDFDKAMEFYKKAA